SGKTILDETLTTYDNGFVGLWLPRGIDATRTVSSGDRIAKQDISSRIDDPTCLTGHQRTRRPDAETGEELQITAMGEPRFRRVSTTDLLIESISFNIEACLIKHLSLHPL